MQSEVQAPHQQIGEIIFGFWRAVTLAQATQLGLADLLADGALSVEALAGRASVHAPSLFRMLRAMESIGIFRQISPGVFANNPVSELLRKDVEGSQAAGIQHQLVKGNGCFEAWGDFGYTLRTGESSMEKIYGYDFWEFLRRNPEANEVMNAATLSLSEFASLAVTAAYDWAKFPVIVDVGGGIGAQIVSILDTSPTLEGIVFDQPHVVAAAIQHDRLKAVGGDFFTSVPPDADGYLLRFVLHDWSDEQALIILQSVRRAMKPSAVLVVAEWFIPEGSEPALGKWSDLHMMVMFRHARERTTSEHRALLEAAGFQLEQVIATPASLSVLIAKPVGRAGSRRRSSTEALKETGSL